MENKAIICNHEPQIKESNSHTYRDLYLLGNKREFCQSFYHIKETAEATIPVECLNDSKCSPKICVGIVYFGNYKCRYSNCKDKYHAEDYLLKDEELLREINSKSSNKLTLYLTLQPCHYSSNNIRKSCSLRLLEFYKRELNPRGIEFEIACTYPYRTHWAILSHNEKVRYGSSIEQAKKGTKILNGFIRTFELLDWERLKHECTEDFEISTNRLEMDLFTRNIFATFK
jgi:hypothetical protein